MTELQTIHQSILTVLAQHKEKSESLWSQVRKGDLTEQGGHKQLAELTAQYGWENTLNKAETWALEFEAAADNAVDAHIKSITAPSGTVNEQLLFETRASRAWERVRRILDTYGDLGVINEACKRLSDSDDPAEHSVLLAELPDYLVARGSGYKEEIEDRLHKALAESDSKFAHLREYSQYAGGIRSTIVSNVRYSRDVITMLVQPETLSLRINDPQSVHAAPVDQSAKVIDGVGRWHPIMKSFVA